MKDQHKSFLSKSQIVKGLQCHKSLYLHKFHPELKDEPSEDLEAKFSSGIEVGSYARGLFPGGVLVEFDGGPLNEQLSKTQAAIAQGVKTIYEAAFSYDGIFVKVDILNKNRSGWNLYEVKQSTSQKDEHIDDIAIQYYVLKGSGLPVKKAYLVHINKEYERCGDIDCKELFAIQDLTDKIQEHQSYIQEAIQKIREMLSGNIPDMDIGEQCKSPYDCEFAGHCWQDIPEQSIFNLRGRLKKFDLYRNGIIHLKDVPKDILSPGQKMQLECTLCKINVINKKRIKQFLASLWYPLCFLDFETLYMVPIPLFDGSRPYQQIPFQFSLHYQKNKKAELGHYEYLAPAAIDPRKELLENLISRIPDDACILVYNKQFEIGRLKELKSLFPKYARTIDNIIENIVDLMVPFQNKDTYYWEMEGSYSIKSVLPAMVPELSYDDMEISDGATASQAFLNTWKMDDQDEIESIRGALLEYCKLDTFGMVRLVEKLREISS